MKTMYAYLSDNCLEVCYTVVPTSLKVLKFIHKGNKILQF